MYVHIGNNCVINNKDIVAVFDIENSTISKKTRDFLSNAEKRKQLINISTDIPRSFVVCEKDSKTTVYLSQLTPFTNLKRCEKKNEKTKFL